MDVTFWGMVALKGGVFLALCLYCVRLWTEAPATTSRQRSDAKPTPALDERAATDDAPRKAA
jgi:hypothetical protein